MLCLISPKKHSHKIAPFKTLLFTGTPCKFCTLLKVQLNGSTIHCSATGYPCHKRLHRNVQATGESQKYFRAELMPLAFFQHLWSRNTRPHLFSNAATEFQYSFSFCMPEHLYRSLHHGKRKSIHDFYTDGHMYKHCTQKLPWMTCCPHLSKTLMTTQSWTVGEFSDVSTNFSELTPSIALLLR